MPKRFTAGKTWIALGLILLIATALRFYGIGWGIPGENQRRSYHPDEKMAPLVLSRMRPDQGQFNPRYLINPTLYYYQVGLLLAPVCKITEITPPWRVKDYIAFTRHDPREQGIWYLTGRIISVLMGVLTVWGVFWIGRLLAGRGVGLASAAIFAVMPAHVIQSHYMVVDGPAVMWMVLSLGFFILGLKRRRTLHFALSGLMLGLGVATKYTAVMIVLPQAVLALQAALDYTRKKSKKKKPPAGSFSLFGTIRSCLRWCMAHWHWLLLWALLGAAGFTIGCPYAIFDLDTFLGAGGIGGIREYNVFGFNPVRIFNTSFFYGLGPPLALFVLAALVRVVSRPAGVMFALGVYLLANIIILMLNASPYMRHFVPLTPFLALCGGYLALELYDKQLPRIPLALRRTLLAAGLLVFGYTTVYSMSLLRDMGREDPRTSAARWLQENVEQYRIVAVTRPEWGEDFYSVPVDKNNYSLVTTGFEYRLVEAYRPDFLVLNEYDLNEYLEDPLEIEFRDKVTSSRDYAPMASFKRKNSFFGVPIPYNPPVADWLYFHPNVTIYGRTRVDSSRIFYIEGRRAYAEKDYFRAEELLVKAVRLEEDNPFYLYWLSFNQAMIFNTVAKKGDKEAAFEVLRNSQKLLERGVKIHPRAWMRIELLGLLSQMKTQEGLGLNNLRRLQESLAVLEEARDLKKQQKVIVDSLSNVALSSWNQQYNGILLVMADSYLGLGKLKEAEEVLIEVLRGDPKHKQALVALAKIVYQDPKRRARSLKLYQQALSLYPELKENRQISETVKKLEQELKGSSPP